MADSRPAADRPLTARERTGSVRWRLVLVWLLRILSTVWLLKGLSAWATILGIGADADPPFEARLLSFQAITVYFAVIDLVAAVGLWLTSTWGGVLWLLACLSQLLLGFFFPQHIALNAALAGGHGVLIGLYFLISWLAANEAG